MVDRLIHAIYTPYVSSSLVGGVDHTYASICGSGTHLQDVL
jgi:hypothetical protein